MLARDAAAQRLSSLSDIACTSTSLASLQARIPTSEWAFETGAGGIELTIVPGSPSSTVIGRHRPPLTGRSPYTRMVISPVIA